MNYSAQRFNFQPWKHHIRCEWTGCSDHREYNYYLKKKQFTYTDLI